ncbi:MAG: elongation factor 4 [Candidatus Pacebacteria bacterium]|jgi:GTP-binding protein LepA|nr:elongation factor 4 [Candidatus Paceibacterota bacterium]
MAKLSRIRNFSIIAHVDHGKTTLTDVFLRLTNAVSKSKFHERMMDSNPIEQEKGVTIKLAPVRMDYQGYVLNLIDTPGHVDFAYEVSRSLAACEGAVLLVDASQGVQAQTLANYQKAKDLGLTIIPVINKIDLPSANIEQCLLEMMEIFNLKEDEILQVSAKTGLGVEKILEAIIERIPAPQLTLVQERKPNNQGASKEKKGTQALIITSKFDNHQGAIAYVRVVRGQINKESLHLIFTNTSFNPIEIGVFTPDPTKKDFLTAGEVGYIATGLKDTSQLKIGDTITSVKEKKYASPLAGYQEPQAMVFMELYPIDSKNYTELKEAMAKLSLHDSALQYQATNSVALGNGLRVGFLGIFHAEIVRERLLREFYLELISTAPSITYQIVTANQENILINNPAELPEAGRIKEIREAICQLNIFSPEEYLSEIMKFCQERRGELKNSLRTANRNQLKYEIPFAELVNDFHDQLKSITSGFGSMDYRFSHYQAVDAVKVDILINFVNIEALSFITIKGNADKKARAIVKKLKEVIPRHMFEIPIQAAIGGKIISRETIKAFRKDVTAKLYGGDRTRRMKLLKKQSKGKKRMKQFGKVELNQEAFLAVLEN